MSEQANPQRPRSEWRPGGKRVPANGVEFPMGAETSHNQAMMLVTGLCEYMKTTQLYILKA